MTSRIGTTAVYLQPFESESFNVDSHSLLGARPDD